MKNTPLNRLQKPLTALSLISFISAACVVMPISSPSHAQTTEIYKLAPEDVLEIGVDGEPDLSKTVTVLFDGTIYYPFVGQYKVAGLTVDAVKDHITTKLKTQLRSPQVTVIVTKRHDEKKGEPPSISVFGAVRSAGKIPIKEGWRFLDVLAACGGLTSARPDWVTATLIRADGSPPTTLNLARLLTDANPTDNITINGGEIIFIKEKEVESVQTQVQVLGEIGRQGFYPVPPNGSLISLIFAAGGATPQAALTKALIRRNGKVIPVNLVPLFQVDPEAQGTSLTNEPHLEPGDTLYIPAKVVRKFAIVGAVANPGPIVMPEGRTVDINEAMFLVGGDRNADLKNARLLRQPNPAEPPIITPIDLQEELKNSKSKENDPGKIKKILIMNPGDVLFIPEKGSNNRFKLQDAVNLLPIVSFLRFL